MEIEPLPAFSIDALNFSSNEQDDIHAAPKASYSKYLKTLAKPKLAIQLTTPTVECASKSSIRRESSSLKTVSFDVEEVELDSLDEGSPVHGTGVLKITEIEACIEEGDWQNEQAGTLTTMQPLQLEEVPQVTTAGTQNTVENAADDESPVHFNNRVTRFSFEEEVRASETEFEDRPVLAYCKSCKHRALTVVQTNKSWLSSCFLWLKCIAPQEVNHTCGNCGQVLGHAN